MVLDDVDYQRDGRPVFALKPYDNLLKRTRDARTENAQ